MIVQFPVDLEDEDAVAETINDLQAHLNKMIVKDALDNAKYNSPDDSVEYFKTRINKYAKLNNDEFEDLQEKLFVIAEGNANSQTQWQFSIMVLRLLTRQDPSNRKRLTDVISTAIEEG